jgi:hypothetical protein
MEREKKADQVSVRLDPDMRATLERIAAQEDRTLSSQVRHLVSRALKDEPRRAAHEVAL